MKQANTCRIRKTRFLLTRMSGMAFSQRPEVKFTQVAVLETHHIPSAQNALSADRQLDSVVIILFHLWLIDVVASWEYNILLLTSKLVARVCLQRKCVDILACQIQECGTKSWLNSYLIISLRRSGRLVWWWLWRTSVAKKSARKKHRKFDIWHWQYSFSKHYTKRAVMTVLKSNSLLKTAGKKCKKMWQAENTFN